MIELSISKERFVPKFLPFITDYSHRWEFWLGGAGSGKSYTIAQKLVIRACSEKITILVCRRYGTTLRKSCFSLFNEIIDSWRLRPFLKIRETDMNIKFPNGSEIIMTGLDEETKLLSLNNIGTIWCEEAFEIPEDIVQQLNLRMRANINNQQIILSWNPISKAHWLYKFSVENPPEGSISHHSTFKDNPFLNKEYIDALEDMRTRNPDKAKIYYYGEWGVISDALVFKNWRIDDINPLELASLGLEHKVGSDLGFVDPTTVLESFYDAQNRKIYVFNEFYKSGVQLDTVASWIKEQKIKTKIWFDSAEPRSIDYFKRQGINAVPAIKGQNSVKARIQFLQNNEIIVSPSCPHLIEELENCQWAKNRSTNEYTDEISDHKYTHCIDGLGYSYSNIYTNDRLKSFDKKLLGL